MCNVFGGGEDGGGGGGTATCASGFTDSNGPVDGGSCTSNATCSNKPAMRPSAIAGPPPDQGSDSSEPDIIHQNQTTAAMFTARKITADAERQYFIIGPVRRF